MDPMKLRALTAQVVFTLAVDYSRKLADAIELCHFDHVHNNVTDREEYSEEEVWNPFGGQGKGALEVNFELFDGTEHHDWHIMEDAMKRSRCRSANAKELLAFAEKNPELQRAIRIIALQSKVLPPDRHFIACLDGDSEKRELEFHVFGTHGGTWSDCLFLGVRK